MAAHAIELIVVGGSAGSLEALAVILPGLPAGYRVPIAIVIHLPPDQPSHLVQILASGSRLPVKEAEDKEPIAPGTLYVAPVNYHLLVEKSGCFALSVDEPVQFSRPAIDVLFESSADACGSRVLGLLLPGANDDGARGLARIGQAGGTTIVQSPESSPMRAMPDAAIARLAPTHVLPLAEIAPYLVRIGASSLPSVRTG